MMIADTGHGMDADILAHVFEPFFTTKGIGAGTGLSLSMVYGVVKQANGYIWVDSCQGVGTTILIHLSQVDEREVIAPSPLAPALGVGHGTILLVEDEVAVRS